MKLSRGTQHKLRVLACELDHLVVSEGQPILVTAGELATYVSDWDKLQNFLMPEVILHTEVSGTGSYRRSRALWLTVTEVPTSLDVTIHNVDQLLKGTDTSVEDALNVLGSAVGQLPEKEKVRAMASLRSIRRMLRR